MESFKQLNFMQKQKPASRYLDQKSQYEIEAARRRAQTAKKMFEIDKRHDIPVFKSHPLRIFPVPSTINQYYHTNKLADIQISMKKVSNFLNESKTLMATDANATKYLKRLNQFERELTQLQRQYKFQWEVVKYTVKDVANTAINFVTSWTTKILNLIIQVANFCCSTIGLGEPFKVIPPPRQNNLMRRVANFCCSIIGLGKPFNDPYNQQKNQELNKKQSRKKQLQKFTSEMQAKLQREQADLKVLKQNPELSNRIISHVKYFIEYELPEIMRKVQSDMEPRI